MSIVSRRPGVLRLFIALLGCAPGSASRRLAAAAAAACVVVVCGLFAPAALAQKSVVGFVGIGPHSGIQSGGSLGGQFGLGVAGVAVNTSGKGGVPAGTFYVVDPSNNRVQEFSPSGAFVRTWGWGVVSGTSEFESCTTTANCRAGTSGGGAGQLTDPEGVAVDQATGIVYVTEFKRVDAFSAAGTFEGAFGWGVTDGAPALEFCTLVCQGGLSGSGAGEFSESLGYLAVDSAGNVYVADPGDRRVDVFATTVAGGVLSGVSFTDAFGWGAADGSASFEVCSTSCHAPAAAGSGLGQFGSGSPTQVAVDAAGDVYTLDAGNDRVQEFSSGSSPAPVTAGFGQAALSAAFGAGSLVGLAVDPGDGDVLVAGLRSGDAGLAAVEELDPTGGPVALQGSDLTVNTAAGLAANGAALGGDIYLTASFNDFDAAGDFDGQLGVFVLNDAPTMNPVTTFTANTATFTGSVVSNSFATSYQFQYSIDGTNWTSVPASAVNGGAAAGTIPVSQNVTDLVGSQAYQVRLAQTRSDGTFDSSSASFTTPPAAPAVSGGSVSGVTATAATLIGQVNPENQTTTYHFEYGPTTGYGASVPVPEAGAGAGGATVSVRQLIGGLAPGTTYHYRLVATNATGSTDGPDQTFTTFPSAAAQSCPNAQFRFGYGASLPDCRAYEQVSPVDKGQQDVTTTVLIGSVDGNAAAFSTAQPLPGAASGAVTNGNAAARGATGWQTSPLDPPLDTQTGRNLVATAFIYGATADFGQALVATNAALTPGAIAGQGAQNLYVHDTGDGSYQLVATNATVFPQSNPTFAGASSDGNQWFFASRFALASTPAPPAGVSSNLYEWSSSGGLALVGILPDGTVDPQGSAAAGNASVTIADHVVSADGSRVYWTQPSGQSPVYLREGNQTVVVSHDQSGAAQPGTFWYATPDGSNALITSTVPLTANASPAGSDLYSYDAGSGTLTDLTPDSTDAGGAGVIGAFGSSDDGSYVYFLATGALASGASAGNDNIYVWHNNQTRFIGALASDPTDITGNFSTKLGLRWRVSPDGQGFGFLFDGAISGPHPQPAQPFDEAYYYSYSDDSLNCASCLPNGGTPTGPASFAQGSAGGQAFPTGYAGSPLVATSGGQLFFNSPDALLPADINDVQDVYEYEGDGSGSCNSSDVNGGCLFLISTGHSSQQSVLAGASASGRDVFFTTDDQLVGQDQDTHIDLYDARIDGGLASQNPPTPTPPCSGDGCKGAIAAAPQAPVAATVSFSGPGNTKGPKASTAKARVLTKTVHGASFTIAVRAPGKGTIAITGTGIKSAKHAAPRAGTYHLRVTLNAKNKRQLTRRHQLTLKLRVAFTPTGATAQSMTVRLAVKSPGRPAHHTRHTATKRGGAR